MAESENAMKQRKCLRTIRPIIGCILITLLLNACTFSIEILSTPTSSPLTATQTSIPSVPTLVLPTAIPLLPTPTLISIRVDTLSLLEIFTSFGEGEALRSLAFTPDGTVLASAGGNNEDFAI